MVSQTTGREAAASPSRAPSRRNLILRYGTGLLILALLWGALVVLDRWLDRYSIQDIRRALGRIEAWQLLGAAAVSAASYALLTLYDVLALRHLRKSLPYRWVAFTAFTSYAFSHSLGFASIVGATVRYRLYTPLGLNGVEVAQVTLFVVTTFTIGLAVVLPLAGALDPSVLTGLGLPPGSGMTFGVLAVAGLVLYVAAGAWFRAPLRILGHDVALPRPSIAMGQIALGLCDLALAAMVLHLCLPASGAVAYADTLVVFGVALVAGIISHVPGGLGVFDAIVLVGLSPMMAGDDVMAGLLVFRVLYYLAPLVLAGVLFGGIEALQARHRLLHVSRRLRVVVGPAVPLVLAACTFVTGAFLLLSRATPEETLPSPLSALSLPLVEMSHFTGSVVGILLILLSHAVQRRVRAAWVLSVVLLGLGCLSALLKGGDWLEAIVPAAILLALIPARREFYRRGPALSRSLSPTWFVATGVALASALWLGLFSYKGVRFEDDLWWQFALHGDASRFLRAAVAVGVVALAAALIHLISAATGERGGASDG